MPYRPDQDAKTLREVLKRLSGDGVGAKALLHQLELAGRAPQDPNDRISRAALSEFINGRDSRKRIALVALWDFLREDKDYRAYFVEGGPVDAASFAATVARFFTPHDTALNTFVTAADIQTVLAGQFVFYRRNRRTMTRRRFFRVSLLSIEPCSGGLQATETQDFIDEGRQFEQMDEGAVFPYGPYAYFLTKEKEGRRVMFGVIKASYPTPDSKKPVEWFNGVVSISSIYGIHAGDPFFCRRIAPEYPPRFGVMELGEIRDAEAAGTLAASQPV